MTANNLSVDAEIAYLCDPPSPLTFYREFVSENRPCIINNAFNDWPALYLWSNAYLQKKMDEREVTVAATPNGRADDVYDNQCFVLPEERKMKFYEFVDHLEMYHNHIKGGGECNNHNNKYIPIVTHHQNIMDEEKKENDNYCSLCSEVLYCQLQNGCMESEYGELCDDIQLEIPFVSEALIRKPDAINLWMGESRSVSSLHQDPYENMYCVLFGEKHFLLYPPTSEPFLKKEEFQTGRYDMHSITKQWMIRLEEGQKKVRWIDTHSDSYLLNKERETGMRRVVVRAGEMLYLPRLYFHEVRQKSDEFGRVIAVNFWYDMNYDLTWNLIQFMKNVIYQ